MSKVTKFVGLDVHKSTIAIAICEGGATTEARSLGTVAHDLTRLLARLKPLGEPEQVHVAYEAGPTGFGLCRALRERGYLCIVVAPSKTPVRKGDRVKTDRRDAEKLARYLRSGELVAIDLPDVQREALRDLVRAREDAMRALRRARQQLGGFLLRHDRRWPGKSTWTSAHMEWIHSQRFEIEAQRLVLNDYYQEVTRLGARLKHLLELLETAASEEAHRSMFRALQGLRGVSTITAATLVAELGDLRRFASAPKLMSYVGLTPSEESSGNRVRRGRITKAGNTHVRRALVEAAWSCRLRPAMTRHMKKRTEGLPLPVIDIASKARERLYRRYTKMRARGKSPQNTITACARELVGFVWAIGQHVSPETK